MSVDCSSITLAFTVLSLPTRLQFPEKEGQITAQRKHVCHCAPETG